MHQGTSRMGSFHISHRFWWTCSTDHRRKKGRSRETGSSAIQHHWDSRSLYFRRICSRISYTFPTCHRRTSSCEKWNSLTENLCIMWKCISFLLAKSQHLKLAFWLVTRAPSTLILLLNTVVVVLIAVARSISGSSTLTCTNTDASNYVAFSGSTVPTTRKYYPDLTQPLYGL